MLEALHDGAGTTVGESHLPSRNTCAIHGSKVECCSVLGDEEAFRVSHKGILQLDDGVRGEGFDERDTDVLRTSLEALMISTSSKSAGTKLTSSNVVKVLAVIRMIASVR